MVSAIVLAYNRRAEVLLTITKLKEQKIHLKISIEIIVVDNASTDGTSHAVGQLHPDVHIITKKKNNGIAGWNEGFKAASGKYLLVLDDDSSIVSGLQEAVNFMELHPDTGILALNIVDQEMNGDPNLPEDEAWKDKELIIGFIGCGAIIRKEVFEKIGGYAEWIYLYSHEFDYSLRCMQAGYYIQFFEQGKVIHRVSSVNRSVKRMRTFSVRNEMLIVYKYFRSQRTKYIFRTLINNLKCIKREGVRSWYYTLSGTIMFLKMRKQLGQTPLSQPLQDFYSARFWSVQPVLAGLRKRIKIYQENKQYKHAE